MDEAARKQRREAARNVVADSTVFQVPEPHELLDQRPCSWRMVVPGQGTTRITNTKDGTLVVTSPWGTITFAGYTHVEDGILAWIGRPPVSYAFEKAVLSHGGRSTLAWEEDDELITADLAWLRAQVEADADLTEEAHRLRTEAIDEAEATAEDGVLVRVIDALTEDDAFHPDELEGFGCDISWVVLIAQALVKLCWEQVSRSAPVAAEAR